TLIQIAAPPVLVSALGSAATTIAFREIAATSSDIRMVLYIFLLLAGFVIVICGFLFSIIVIGGATRNLVAHLPFQRARQCARYLSGGQGTISHGSLLPRASARDVLMRLKYS